MITAEPTTQTTGALPVVLTVSELQQLLRLGRNQTYALLESGALYSVRIGRSIRIPRDAVERFLSGLPAS